MNEREFKKHLKDLAHGKHHPEEHDWVEGGAKITGEPTASGGQAIAKKPAKRATTARGNVRRKKA